MLVDAMALESIATQGRAWYFETRTLSLRVGALVAVCVVAIGCRSGAAKVEDGPCARDVAPFPASIQRGMSVAHNYQDLGTRGYGSNTSDHTLRELARFGVEWVSLTPFGFMRSLDEPAVHFIGNYPGGETDERMEGVIEQARRHGLGILLKPHLWIARGEWRGEIGFDQPADWNRWFDSYERWILHYAKMAQRYDVEAFVVGVEFRSSQSSMADRWRALVAKVREVYRGQLTYSANWDDASELPWWDALDYIGVQFYPPLSMRTDPDLDTVRAAVSSRLDELETLSKRFAKPVLFTEVGYRAADDALQHPHEWPERVGETAVNTELQALGYQAFVGSVRKRSWVRGVYWWKWFTDPSTDEEGPAGFSPRGRPAERVLRAAFDGSCAPP